MIEKVNFRNKIGYSAIAGGISGVVYVVLQFLLTSMNIGTLDDIEADSQFIFGTTAGNPNVVGYVIFNIVVWILFGIIIGSIIFVLMTRAGWERNFT